MFLDIPMKTCYTHRFLLLNSHSAAATSRIKGIAAFQVVRFIGVLGRVRKITVFTINPMDAYGWFIFFWLTSDWLWLWRMMIHNDLGNCTSFLFSNAELQKTQWCFCNITPRRDAEANEPRWSRDVFWFQISSAKTWWIPWWIHYLLWLDVELNAVSEL